MAKPALGGGEEPATPPDPKDLEDKLSKAILRYNAELSACETGSLVQVWQPVTGLDGEVVLHTQGLPFSISGVGDLLALFRCVSCKFRFPLDLSKPHLFGAIGRAYMNSQVEICSDVQQHDQSIFLRHNETQRCRIHSLVVLPVFHRDNADKPIGVIEVSHHEKEVKFSSIISRMDACLKEVELHTMNVGDIDSFMGDGVGVRYQIFGPGRALATAGTASECESQHLNFSRERRTIAHEPQGCSLQKSLPLCSPLGVQTHVNGLPSMAPLSASAFSQGERVQNKASGQIEYQNKALPSADENRICPFVPETSNLRVACKDEGESWGGENLETSDMGEDDHMDQTAVVSGSSGLSGESCGMEGVDSVRGIRKHDNRLGGGAGKRLNYQDLQSQFAVGLKEAATRLGICPTTLKRACRRNGISRWPSRQIAKLSKAWSQMGYSGSPPAWLVKNAIAGNLKADNLAFALNTGLHMGLIHNLGTSNIDDIGTSELQSSSQGLCSFTSELDPTESMMDKDNKPLVTMSSSASALNLSTMDEGFLSRVNGIHDQTTSGNHTWHAGQAASSLLPASGLCGMFHETSCSHTMLVPPVSQPVNLDFLRAGVSEFECPTNTKIEGTQRGTDLVPMLAGFDGLSDLSNLLSDPGNDDMNVVGDIGFSG